MKIIVIYLSVTLLFVTCTDKSKEQRNNAGETTIVVANSNQPNERCEKIHRPETPVIRTMENMNENKEEEKDFMPTVPTHDAGYSENKNLNNRILSSNINITCEPSGWVDAIYEANWSYRKIKRGDIYNTYNIIGLFCENNVCYLKPTNISFLDGENECSGDATLTFISEAKFLFSNSINYNKNNFQSVISEVKPMLPGEKFVFTFEDQIYELESFGERLNSDGYDVKNYLLVYSTAGAASKQTIVSIPTIEYTSVKLLFIGDLDGDGKPDIILDAPSNYENKNIILFLSSTANDDEYLRCEACTSDWFDC